MAGKQTEFAYKAGYNIVQVQHHGTFNNYESMGFEVDQAYVVKDDFDEFTLPTLQQTFWTPGDAASAIDTVLRFEAVHKKQRAKWPTTVIHEYNIVINYRRKWHVVMASLAKIEKMCEDDGFGEAASAADILKELAYLRQSIMTRDDA